MWFSTARTKLTDAESEVATMLVAGWSNVAIATARRVSPTTVANQARSIYAKLGISSRAELVALKDPL
jgi:DNA-binding NarL/FixJ family response regulator